MRTEPTTPYVQATVAQPIDAGPNMAQPISKVGDDKPQASKIIADYVSEIGRYHLEQHTVNEDDAGYNDRFFGVADGVGGGMYGEVAAQTMIASCLEQTHWQDAEDIRTILEQAQRAVTSAILNRTQGRGGCAFAGVWFDAIMETLYYTWVGDVRIYHIYPDNRPERQQNSLLIKRLTVDQTYANLGEHSPSGNQDNLARLVGFDAMGQPDICTLSLRTGEFLLILGDGVYNFVSHQYLQVCCQKLLQPDVQLKTVCQELVDVAKQNHSHDDCTALLLTKVQLPTPHANTDTDLTTLITEQTTQVSSSENSADNIDDCHAMRMNAMALPCGATKPSNLAGYTDSAQFDDATYRSVSSLPFKVMLMAVLFWLFGLMIGRLDGVANFLENYLF